MPSYTSKTTQLKASWKLLNAAVNKSRPVLVQLVVTRRCNLACGYCFEYDNVSKPIDLAILKSRIDHLKRLRAVFVTLNGGEPLLHPKIVELVAYIKQSGMIPMMNSNGHVLKPALVERLNAAGLFGIQLSCDGLEDNEVSKKSLKRLRPKLDMLREQAKFRVRINSVIGANPPAEVLEVAQTILGYGFDFQCSLMRDAAGRALPLDAETLQVYEAIRKLRNRLPVFLHDNFQVPLAQGETINWKCRAGARHFEVDEHGTVHFCQPRTGAPGKPLADYTKEDILRNFNLRKKCTQRCPVAYAHLGSRMDAFRKQKTQG